MSAPPQCAGRTGPLVRVAEDHGVDARADTRRGHPVHRFGGHAEPETPCVRVSLGVQQMVWTPSDRDAARGVVTPAANRDAVRPAFAARQQRPQQRSGCPAQVGFRQARLDQRGGPHGEVRALPEWATNRPSEGAIRRSGPSTSITPESMSAPNCSMRSAGGPIDRYALSGMYQRCRSSRYESPDSPPWSTSEPDFVAQIAQDVRCGLERPGHVALAGLPRRRCPHRTVASAGTVRSR